MTEQEKTKLLNYRCGYRTLFNNDLKVIWGNDGDTFILKIARSFLLLIQILHPGFLVRTLTVTFFYIKKRLDPDKYYHAKVRPIKKNVVDFYVLLKAIFAIASVYCFPNNSTVLVFVMWSLMETHTYLVSLVFFNDIYSAPYSPRRNIMLMFFNYFEITFSFAYLNLYFADHFKGVSNSASAVYYSFVTSATLGYGDICPKDGDETAYVIVIVHLVYFFTFIGLLFNYFMGILNSGK